ncbi:epimerase [Agaricicola taiwanensis]|uniref:Epimerase n=1 Tax=Agaricicola taiwanensis TaxID=591372 RepID=A0A8J2YGD6_9RHOB|nr:NAD-dependent epimerase/dehydratase family protein [Agaricicola taiwanensis]GGE35314.1 epimerase [Agaricicola taiwanensis]
MRVLVTGATGFVGQGLVPALIAAGHSVRVALREPGPLPPGVEAAVIGDLSRPINRSFMLEGTDAVVHAAGIAHQGPDVPEELYRRVNTEATVEIAKAAARAGVRRFVFLSSIRAQSGPSSEEILTEDISSGPTDPYGRSKQAAEQALSEIDVPSVILRPVLIHGPGVRYNMAALMKLAASPWPLPLSSLTAKRSIVARDHLADAVLLALRSDKMAGETYIVADPEPLTVGEMIASLRRGLGKPALLFGVPAGLLSAAATLANRQEQIERLMSPLVARPDKLLAAGWQPRLSAAEALAKTAGSKPMAA